MNPTRADVKFNDIEPRILSRFTSNKKKSFIKEKKKKMVTRSSKSSAEQLVTVREKISLKKFSVAAAGNAAGSSCPICRGALIVGLDHSPSDSIRTMLFTN